MSKPTLEKSRKSRAQRSTQASEEQRALIVEATRECLNLTGHEKLRMEAIAKRAQCSRATLYRYFGGKEEIVQAIAAENYQRINKEVDEEIRQVSDLRMKLAIGLARSMAVSQLGDGTHKFTAELVGNAMSSSTSGMKAIIIERVGPVYKIAVRDGWARQGVSKEDAINWIMLSSTGLLEMGWPNIGGHILSPDEQVQYMCRFLLFPIFQMEDVLD